MPTNDDPTLDENGNPIQKPDEDPSKSTGNPSPNPTPKTYTEAEYKGLQAVISRRDETIRVLTGQVNDLTGQLALEKANNGTVANEKTLLTGKVTEHEASIGALTKENVALKKQLARKDIVLSEFPDLAGLSKYLPDTENDDDFRKKAMEFRSEFKKYVGNGVSDLLGGSSIPVETNSATLGADELDKAYREVAALAGRPGKEKEFDEANKRYQDLLKARNSQSTG